MRSSTLVLAVALLLIALPASAQTQTPMTPTVPGAPGDPVWQGTLHMSDGRVFITDGGLAIDVAVARPAVTPARELSAKRLEDFMKAAHTHEYGFADLALAPTGKTYTAPGGIVLNSTYINYLRRVAPRGSRLRMTDGTQPIVVVANGTPIAVLMPVKS